MKERRQGAWFLLTGLILGLVVGLAVSLLASPVYSVDVAPHMLAGQDKDDYRALIALAYMADGDLGRARARLSLLKDENLIDLLTAQAQKSLASGTAPEEARALALLAEALQEIQSTPSQETVPSVPLVETETTLPEPQSGSTLDAQNAIRTPTSAPLASITPHAAATLLVTPIPEALLNAPFILYDQAEICDNEDSNLLIQEKILDQNGVSIPGVSLEVTWSDGQNFFYTGLHPRIDPGYANFSMQPGVEYTLRAGTRGQIVDNLIAPDCTAEDGSTFAGGWNLVFVAP